MGIDGRFLPEREVPPVGGGAPLSSSPPTVRRGGDVPPSPPGIAPSWRPWPSPAASFCFGLAA